MKYGLLTALITLACYSYSQKTNQRVTEVKKATLIPLIDGRRDDDCWVDAEWYDLDQRWLGEEYSKKDFSGRYKLSWSKDALYLLVEIKDDVLLDKTPDPLKAWWDDDCVEVFIDEDNSGGDHQYSHNAFAYHVALDYNVVDLAPDGKPRLYNNHIQVKRLQKKNTSIWEMAIHVYRDDYEDGKKNQPIYLQRNKRMGFALAYCDNDASAERENFIGSEVIEGEDKNRGWIDAGIFGTLVLVD
ncbi:MAG: CBM9 family sugar-binding protein [Cytophagales bacterium]|nr:CBM9 family sugar-binding protein [Cytophagales bacterium]